jgi:hypothetical protein
MNKQQWVEEAREAGATIFAIDATVYADDKVYNKCLYALSGTLKRCKLVGAYSVKSGAKVFHRDVQSFSAKGRTFVEVSI